MRWILIDRFLELVPGKMAVAVRNFSRAESFFMDHFPGFPIVPGALHVEMIAQTGGSCVRAARPDVFPVLASIKSAKFYHKIVPGDRAVIRTQVTLREDFSIVEGSIEVEGSRVCAATLMLANLPIPPGTPGRFPSEGALSDWLQEQAHEPGPLE